MYMNDKNLPYEYKPISMWGYFGYEILFSIPFIGFILLLVFSFGGTKNINLRNFARSYFCFSIIVIIFIAIIYILIFAFIVEINPIVPNFRPLINYIP